jgi:hypothetical protein
MVLYQDNPYRIFHSREYRKCNLRCMQDPDKQLTNETLSKRIANICYARKGAWPHSRRLSARSFAETASWVLQASFRK